MTSWRLTPWTWNIKVGECVISVDLITDFKHKQWICLTKLPDLDCHLRGHGDEDVRDEVVPGDGPDWGYVGGITPERGGAVVKSAEMQETTLRANKVGVLSIRGQYKCVAKKC